MGRLLSGLGLGAAGVVVVAIGTVIGMWAWTEREKRQQAAEKAEAAEYEARVAETPFGRQRAAVLRYLYDPASASFRNERPSPHTAGVWCGEVNARNRMGGHVGFSAYVVTLEDEPELRELDSAVVDPGASSSKAEEQLAFLRKYALLCLER